MGKNYHWFDAYGFELEYMIVDRETLAVMPVADRLIEKVAGKVMNELEFGKLGWSNELALHVIEIKTLPPVSDLPKLAADFQGEVAKINDALKEMGAMLLPTGAHPLMDPHRETKLWPHGNRSIYYAYNRIFDCRGHGWGNLQSVHINFPFCGDEEFGMLHAAIRLVLPLIPALCASTPVLDGSSTGFFDARLETYRKNQVRIPEITGKVIPERAYTIKDYEGIILKPMYKAISPFDEKGILQDDWLNSRGVIARFDRNCLEIKVMDIQECPAADLALSNLIIQTVKALATEKWQKGSFIKEFHEERLQEIFLKTVREGSRALIEDADLLSCFGINETKTTAGEVWKRLAQEPGFHLPGLPVEELLKHGTLAERIMQRLGNDWGDSNLREVYRDLAVCLAEGRYFP